MTDEGPNERRMPSATPSLRELAVVLFRRRRAFVWGAAVVYVGVLLYGLAGARYQGEMKIMVRRGRADAPVSAGQNAPLDTTRIDMTEEELNSEVELLKDQDVLRKVVEVNGAGPDWLHFLRFGETREERIERAARRLAKRLAVAPVKKSNLITVTYAADDPQKAAQILRSVADAYLERHTGVHRPGGEANLFQELTAQSRQELDEAERSLEQFSAVHGVVSAAQERDLALVRLSEIDKDYRLTRVDLEEARQKVKDLEDLLATQPERTTTQVRIADNPDLFRKLKGDLLDLQLKRTQLLTKYEPGHRLVQEVDEQIAQAQAAIAAENGAPLRDETTDKNSHYEWAKSEAQSARVRLKALEAREAAMGAEEAVYRAQASQLGNAAIRQEDLQKSEKAAQESYLLYVKKREEARMADALDQRGIVNVAMAEEPVAPALPRWSTLLLLTVGLAAAGAAGTGAAFAAEHMDPAFRNPDEVVAYLHAPVLASLPRVHRGRLLA